MSSLQKDLTKWMNGATKTGVRNAEAYLQTTRHLLIHPTIHHLTRDILERLDRKEIYPSQAINLLYVALAEYWSNAEMKHDQEKIHKKQIKKKWWVQIWDHRLDKVVEEKGFAGEMEARDWVDGRMDTNRQIAHIASTVDEKTAYEYRGRFGGGVILESRPKVAWNWKRAKFEE